MCYTGRRIHATPPVRRPYRRCEYMYVCIACVCVCVCVCVCIIHNICIYVYNIGASLTRYVCSMTRSENTLVRGGVGTRIGASLTRYVCSMFVYNIYV